MSEKIDGKKMDDGKNGWKSGWLMRKMGRKEDDIIVWIVQLRL